MSDFLLKRCTRCKDELSLDKFHRDAKAADGFYSQCIECRKKKRALVLTPEEQKQLARIDRQHAANQKIVDTEGSSANSLRQAHNFLDVKEIKLRKKLQEDIDTRLRGIKAAQLAKAQQGKLIPTQELFPPLGILPVGEKRNALVSRLQQHQASLKGEEFDTARSYIESQIVSLTNAIEDERLAEVARVESAEAAQNVLDKAAGDKAAHEIFDKFRPYFLTPFLELKKREELRLFCLEQAARYRELEKSELKKEKAAC